MVSLEEAIAANWEMHLRNPDPPQEDYSYPYYLRSEESAWSEFLGHLGRFHPDRVVIITEQTLPAHLREASVARVRSAFPTVVLTFSGGEENKHLLTVQRLLDEAMAARVSRASVILALGGGLVGNVAGLLAGICLRGLPLVQVPTTLLAQSDSVLSLKQGVNGPYGKNHAGLLKAPAFVWSHLSFLESLPQREMRAALCESIKNALAIKPDQIPELLHLLHPQAQYTPAQLARIIELAIEAKTTVMAADALEQHQAVVLEYGHTVGHAIELLAKGTIPHGEAVGMGMMVEGEIARCRGRLAAEDWQMHDALLHTNGSPTTIPGDLSTEALITIMRHDKKRGYLPEQTGKLVMVQLEALGQPERTKNTLLTPIDEQEVRAALTRCR